MPEFSRGEEMPHARAHDDGMADRVVFAGVDEAGLGPLLGPLCVGAVALSVPKSIADEPALAANLPGHLDFWAVLHQAVTRDHKTTDRRTVICDSKILHTPKSIKPIEESVLAFAAAMAEAGESQTVPPAFSEFLHRFSLVPPARFTEYPWYAESRLDFALPVEALLEKCRQRGENIAKCVAALDGRFEGLRVRPVLVRDFNHLLAATGNKSDAHFDIVAGMVGKIWERFPHVRIMVDKAGARDFYKPALQRAFPEAHIERLAEAQKIPNSQPIPADDRESKRQSRGKSRGPSKGQSNAGSTAGTERFPVYSSYRLTIAEGARSMQIDFAQDGENESMLISLASLFAKYTRENCMAAENQFWRERVPGIKPTKGYVQDGRRFLADLEAAGEVLGDLRAMMVRDK